MTRGPRVDTALRVSAGGSEWTFDGTRPVVVGRDPRCDVRLSADRVSRVVLRDGAVSFSITAGKLHDVVFAVRDQRWRLLPGGDMEQIAA